MTFSSGTVVVVDDDASVRKSLDRLLGSAGYVVRTYASAEDFLLAGPPPRPACAVLDLELPGLSGIELQARMLEMDFRCGILFLTGHGDMRHGVKAMKQGAVDFLPKPIDEGPLFLAIDETLARELRRLEKDEEISSAASLVGQLTKREQEVMQHVVQGRLNKQIAGDLNISEKTVKAHRASVMRKTGAGSVAELVRLHLSSRGENS